MKNRIIPIEKLESLIWKPGDILPDIKPPAGSSNGSGSSGVDFCIEELGDRYVLRNVQYNGGVYSFGVMKDLLDGGNSHTQGEWIELTKDSEVKLGSVPDWFAIMFAIYDNKEGIYSGLVERIKALLVEDFDPKKPWMATSTRAIYNSRGKDKVIHNKGYKIEFEIEEDIAGNNGYVEPGLENAVKPLCGTDNITKIKEVMNWITGKKIYLWRRTKPTTGSEEWAVVFGVSSIYGNFVIVANDSVNYWPSRGVVVVRENSP
ncbi:hypothetical protein HZA97_07205 [Candidatus Woesearchaeota archaeon]|nr:hypothetical protein [Candidatus Woesearchaeota archaeon]